MKNFKYILGSIAVSILIASCEVDPINVDSELIHSTGDQADDPVEPDEDAIDTAHLFSSTGDQADDPVEPDEDN